MGQRFGKLTVLRKSDIKKNNNYAYLCKCDCGKEHLVKKGELVRGRTVSCGCLRIERAGNINRLPKGESSINGLLTRYTIRARRASLDFSISREQFKKLIVDSCYYCGELPGPHVFLGMAYNGIDRVDNNKGYDVSNLVTCCADCNLMKRLMTVDNFFTHIVKIVKTHKLLK